MDVKYTSEYHLIKAAENLMNSMNEFHVAQEEYEELGYAFHHEDDVWKAAEDKLHNAAERRADAWDYLREAIHYSKKHLDLPLGIPLPE